MKKAGSIISVVVRWSLGIPCALMAIAFLCSCFHKSPLAYSLP